MSDLSMFEKPLLKEVDEEVVSSSSVMYGGEAIKGVQEILKDTTPFKMAASVRTFLLLYLHGIYISFT